MDAMGQFREEVMWAVNSVLDAMGAKVQFEVEVPDQDKADLAIPCFPMAKVLRKNPVEIANQIVSGLPPMPTIERAWRRSLTCTCPWSTGARAPSPRHSMHSSLGT